MTSQIGLRHVPLGQIDPNPLPEGAFHGPLLCHAQNVNQSLTSCQEPNSTHPNNFKSTSRGTTVVPPNAGKHFKRNLRKRLEERGDKAALARAAGVSRAAVTAWISRDEHYPGVDKLGAIAEFCKMSIAELFAPPALPCQTPEIASPPG
ncbi:MAG: helix-turn-helix transcriptional regulator, partial [Sulfuricaulis sp.]|nr:helix-turn-helix transcriptional regulator [Sulfuricaulis sp.]